MKIKNLLFVALLITVLNACDTDSEDKKAITLTSVDASSSSDWVYFSFEQGDTISIANAQTSQEWDIAFKRLDFKTNSGTSGSANGGAYKSTLTDMDMDMSIDDDQYIADDSIQVFVYGHGGATLSKEAGSVVLTGEKDDAAYYTTEGVWSVTGEAQARTYTANKNVFFIKCSDGETSKVQFISYYNPEDGKTSGYISFNYIK